MRKQYIILLFLWAGIIAGATAQNYPSLEQFGKNRIQYRNFNWKIIRTANFEIYFYQDGNQLANLTAQYAESEFDRITELLGYTPYNRIKIFLYNSPQELAQSNIGINLVGELDSRELDLAKSRVEIAFTGDQVSFRKRLIHDVSMLFVYDMLYGGSLKDALQSSLLLTLPDWFMPGIAAYIAEGYSIDLDDYMRDVSLNRTIRKPSLLQGRDAERIGQSIWNYIAQKYGRDNISNILNLTRIIRNEQSSIQSTLGVPYSRFIREWREYYHNMAKAVPADGAGNNDVTLRLKGTGREQNLNDLKLSPDKQMLAFASVDDGKFSVEVYNVASKKRFSVLQGGYRLDGHATFTSTPLLAWQRNNDLVAITDENGRSYLYVYTNLDKRPKLRFRRVINGLTQIVGVDASDDGGSLVLSADRRGQNDLFVYNISRGSYAQLTNDLYDDLNPVFVGRGTSRIVFASNRSLDTLGADKGSYRTIKDRFSLFYHEGGSRATSVRRLTDTLSNAVRPIAVSENTIYYLGSANGIQNLYRLSVGDSTTASTVVPITAFPNSIRQYDLVPANGGFVYSFLRNSEVNIGFRSQLPLNTAQRLTPTQRNVALGLMPTVAPKTPEPTPATPGDTTAKATAPAVSTTAVAGSLALEPGEVDTDNYQFDPEVLKAAEYRQRRSAGLATSTSAPMPRSRRRENITIRGPFDYRGLFIASDATSAWRIDPIRGFGFSQNVTMNDLLENHIIKAGLFITTNLRNSDLFAEYQNLTNRIDYGVRVDRQTLFFDNGLLSQKYRFNRVAFSASYPISVTSRFTLSPFYTLTRRIELLNIAEADRTSDYAGLRAEFVYDDSKVNGMNMIEGTRAKLRFENYAGIRSASESFRRITLDFRRYQKLHRDLMLALRLSVSQSGGPAPKQSTLGGMENWIGGQQEQIATNPLLVPNQYSQNRDDYRDVFFLDFATNLRGFRQGKLTGNSHMLLNAELRIPLVKYIYRGNITSNFLRNLQLVAFSDIGTAWSGRGPFNRQNNLNTELIGFNPQPNGTLPPFGAVVTNFKNPFLIGYGAGVRTMLFGYYVKFDYGWGLENNVVNKPVAYLTLGYDF
ncbi:hypothetical protein [Rudanella lutea]|uniref:hypothetical protein n=1 Tax=Rudanella lutea TaxID=451374 RepID=UPI000362EEDD|nr:hypothetical protein [Rudanella lutea]